MSALSTFKRGMRRLAGGVSIVTTCDGRGEPTGLIATSVSSLSIAPPSLLVCVSRAARSHDAFLAAGRFAVNILPREDAALAQRFGSDAFRARRFEDPRWRTDGEEMPWLEGALAIFDCQLTTRFTYGSHSIFVGDVMETRVPSLLPATRLDPLIYLDGRFVACAEDADALSPA